MMCQKWKSLKWIKVNMRKRLVGLLYLSCSYPEHKSSSQLLYAWIYTFIFSELHNFTDSLLAFKKRNKLGRFGDKDPGAQEKKEEEQWKQEEKANTITVGSRCLVTRPGVPTRKGVVRFVGKTEFAEGWWIGVQYDEPFGKNDGR